jgi:hypothetical protein
MALGPRTSHSTDDRRFVYNQRFESGIPTLRAEVAELADAQASGACGRKVVEVQILSSAYHLDRRGPLHPAWLTPLRSLFVARSAPSHSVSKSEGCPAEAEVAAKADVIARIHH